MAKRKTKAETIAAALKSWDRRDEELSGMSDPLKQQGPSDEIVKLWEQNFWTELAKDKEYWADRVPSMPLPQHIIEINVELDRLFPQPETVNGKQPLFDRVLGALLGRGRS